MKVSEVMSTEYETIDKDQVLSKALNIMRKKDASRLIVIDEGKPVGLISFRDVADRLGTYKTEGASPSSLHVSSAMSYPVLSIDSNEEIEKAAQIMVDKRISSLLVIEDGQLKGLLTKFHLLKVYDRCKKIKVKDLMTSNPIQISPNERVIAARNIMMDKKISILPVIEEDKIVGIVDDETLADALARFREQIPIKHQKSRLDEFYIGQIMKSDPPLIETNAPLCDLIKIFQETKYKGVFVVNKTHQLIGIITLTDITKAIVEGKR